VIKRWLSRVEEAASGLTFQEWDPTQHVDTSRPPVAMVISSSNCVPLVSSSRKCFLQHLRDLHVLACAREEQGCERLEGMGPKRFVLSEDDKAEFRPR
jgi:hypothetical protein